MNDNGMKSCPHCGANIDAKYDVCPICGYVLDIDYANYKCNYQNPQGVQPPDATNDMAVGCLCCGIVSLIFCWNIIGLIAAIVGLIFAHKLKKDGVKSGLVTGGKVCSIISIVLFALLLIFLIGLILLGIYISSTAMSMDDMMYNNMTYHMLSENYIAMLIR